MRCGAVVGALLLASAASADWPPGGLLVALLSDGRGGVVMFMRESAATSVPIAMHFPNSPGISWPAEGLDLSSVALSLDFTYDSQLLPSGPDHFLALWTTASVSGRRRVWMQRFGIDATLDPAWPVDGLLVVAPDTLVACHAISDGADGAYVLRQSHGQPVCTHVTGAGTFLGGSNVSLLDAAAQYIPVSQVLTTSLIVDRTPDGGLVVGWNDTRLAPAVTFRLRWLTPSLAAAPDKPEAGIVMFPLSPHVVPGALLTLRADGPDAAFIAWGDYHLGVPGQVADVWMTRVQVPAAVGVGPRVAPPVGLALSSPRPNPSHSSIALDVTLPDDSPARVELLDVAGRAQRIMLVSGAGSHSVTFGDPGALPPGLYLARLSHRSGERSTRVVLTR